MWRWLTVLVPIMGCMLWYFYTYYGHRHYSFAASLVKKPHELHNNYDYIIGIYSPSIFHIFQVYTTGFLFSRWRIGWLCFGQSLIRRSQEESPVARSWPRRDCQSVLAHSGLRYQAPSVRARLDLFDRASETRMPGTE